MKCWSEMVEQTGKRGFLGGKAAQKPAEYNIFPALPREGGVRGGWGTNITCDHRLHALSEASRRQFARYWLVIGPTSWFMLGILLGAVRRRAERDAIALAIG